MRRSSMSQGATTSMHEDDLIPVFKHWVGSWQISLKRRAFATRQLTRFYDQVATDWDRTLQRLGFSRAYRRLLEEAVPAEAARTSSARSGVPPRVLDCGVGTGAFSTALARVLPTGFRLDAVDISEQMLAQASRCFEKLDLEASLRICDVRRLSYEDNVFDVVMAGHLLEHFADPEAALGEMVRVLKPGGLLITCLTRRSLLGMYIHLKWRTHRVTPAEAESWLHTAGLENCQGWLLPKRSFGRQLSVAAIGRKPETGDHSRSHSASTRR